MSNWRRRVTQCMLALFAFSMLSLPFISGCARHPSQEELTQLEQAREAAGAAEEKVEAKKREKVQAEAKLAEKKAALEKAKATKAAVEANLSSE